MLEKLLAAGRKYVVAGVLGCALLFGARKIYSGDENMDLPIYVREPARQQQQEPARTPDDEPPTFFGEAIYGARESLIYVIDKSGSMERIMGPAVDLEGRVRSMTRFQRAQVELKRSILALAPNIRFNVISYDCSVDPWQRDVVPATEENKRAACNWIDGRYPHGGTGTSFGVSYALHNPDNHDVILLTDGEPTCRLTIDEHRALIGNNNRNRARIHVFGVGAYGPFRDFCVRVASDSGGRYSDVR